MKVDTNQYPLAIKKVFHEIKGGSATLYYTGLIHFALAIILIILMFLDDRLVNGENAWLKPMRFASSIFLFTWTFSWFSSFIDLYKKTINSLNLLISICMIIEIGLITLQAVRGVSSHYNVTTALDAAIFSTMGAAIGFNALILGLWFAIFTFFEKGRTPYKSAIVWGMFLFLLGNFTGYLLIRYGWPTDIVVSSVNIPITGWQANFKDLRIGHALGLHAIQILPLINWIIFKRKWPAGLIHLAGFLYLFSLIIFVCLALQ